MISCPTDIYSNTGDCNVDVSDYTGDDADYSGIAARDTSAAETGYDDDDDDDDEPSLWADMDAPTEDNEDTTPNKPSLAARSIKEPFSFCGGKLDVRAPPSKIITKTEVSKLDFQSSGDMLKKKNGYTLNSFLSYGPLNPNDCDDYSFGKIATPAASDSLKFASEHVLEWQLLKNFLVQSPLKSPFVTTTRSNPAALGFKGEKLLPKDPSNPNSEGEGRATWAYCSYVWFWWSRTKGIPLMTYEGLTGSPVDILNKAFPNKENYVSELQLVSAQANNFKERIWGVGAIRKDLDMAAFVTQDVNKAINNCKQLMFAVKYVSEARPRL